MAKLGSYFGLCPLIEHKSLLGISRDSESDKVLLTLGKKIAMQYRLGDQKQILSWTTKEKFTSPVIFDYITQKYVAAFNTMHLRCWEQTDMNVDKVKRLKLNSNIHTLLVIDNITFVVFQSGSIIKLAEVLSDYKNLKTEKLLLDNENIIETLSCSFKGDQFVGLVVANSNTSEHILLWTVFNTEMEGSFHRLSLEREENDLVGVTFYIDDQLSLLTLWSDGKLYMKSLETTSKDIGQVFSVIESISCKYPVYMTYLDKDYIVLYGCNSNQEGALLIIYNMQFKVTQCKQPFKLLTVGAKIWPIEGKLLLPVGQNLAVVPYHLEREQLSSLIGSHKGKSTESDDVIIVKNLEQVEWTKNICDASGVQSDLKGINGFLEQGYCESTIFQEIVPSYQEKNNVKELKLLINTFEDIPEKSLVSLLNYFLELPSKFFKNSKNHKSETYPEMLQPYDRYNILFHILKKPISEVLIIPHLRMDMNLDNALRLMNFILFLIGDEDTSIDTLIFDKLILWISLLLDANYQSFLLSKDEQVVRVLLSFSELVGSELNYLEDLQKLLCVLNQIKKKKKILKIVDSKYAVEKLEF